MKKFSTLLLALTTAAALVACSSGSTAGNATVAETTTAAAGTTTTAAESESSGNENTDTEEESNPDESTAPESTAAGKSTESNEADTVDESTEETAAEAEAAASVDLACTVRVGSLKGPTSIGLVHLMDQAENGETQNSYEFTMVTAADELSSAIVAGNLDLVLIPANVASVLYNKTSGAISVIDINTLGVLDVVASDDSITSIADLKGKTIYMTGKGTTPDYAFHYLLDANGLSEDDVTLEFKSEATEVAALLKEEPDAIGVLPQPFVTAACAQNEALKIVLDLTEEWDAVQGESGSRLVTGVTIVRNDFLNQYPDAVTAFLADHAASAEYTATNPDETAELVAAAGIIEKAAVAKKALPYCNITCLTGEEMKSALSGYLQVLADQDLQSVGGAMPGDDFYLIP
ncbi:MAG: ABC transporter substrate-binding protein [Clostridiales bacterium]|nr:ABC transporter substrate-binding protein [Clostridiales bacterium]